MVRFWPPSTCGYIFFPKTPRYGGLFALGTLSCTSRRWWQKKGHFLLGRRNPKGCALGCQENAELDRTRSQLKGDLYVGKWQSVFSSNSVAFHEKHMIHQSDLVWDWSRRLARPIGSQNWDLTVWVSAPARSSSPNMSECHGTFRWLWRMGKYWKNHRFAPSLWGSSMTNCQMPFFSRKAHTLFDMLRRVRFKQTIRHLQTFWVLENRESQKPRVY